jgi:hypothetical protein
VCILAEAQGAPPPGLIQVAQAALLQRGPSGLSVWWGVEKAFYRARATRECLLSLRAKFLKPGVLARPRARQTV